MFIFRENEWKPYFWVCAWVANRPKTTQKYSSGSTQTHNTPQTALIIDLLTHTHIHSDFGNSVLCFGCAVISNVFTGFYVFVWPLGMPKSKMPQKCRRQQPEPAQNKIVDWIKHGDSCTHNNFGLHMLSVSKVRFYAFKVYANYIGIYPQKNKKYNSELPHTHNTHRTIHITDLLIHTHMHSKFWWQLVVFWMSGNALCVC